MHSDGFEFEETTVPPRESIFLNPVQILDNLPQFERLPINKETEDEDKEIWQPNWNCFCCQDTGQIQAHLVNLIISDYNPNFDRIPVCQGCNKFDRHNLRDYGVLDTRFDLFLCKKLDALSRTEWKRTTEKQFKKYKNEIYLATHAISIPHNLASNSRTPSDEREIHRRKAEVKTITPDQWQAMNKAYFAGVDQEECNSKLKN